MEIRRLACVLSGGGAKAAAHVGAHRAMEEAGLRPARYVGTSMGAVVAACFAGGLSHDEVLRRMLSISRSDVAGPSATLLKGPYARHLLSARRLKETIRRLVPATRFVDLRIPLTVTAVDMDRGDLVLLGAGGDEHISLVEALLASCSLPVFYPPVRVGDRLLADGGLRTVLPLEVAGQFDPDVVFAVTVGPSFAARSVDESNGTPPLLRAHNLAMRTLMAAQTEREIARWREGSVPLVLVEPSVERSATFDVGSVVRYVEDGYRVAVAALRSSGVVAPLDGASAPRKAGE
jgi:NTE family protein